MADAVDTLTQQQQDGDGGDDPQRNLPEPGAARSRLSDLTHRVVGKFEPVFRDSFKLGDIFSARSSAAGRLAATPSRCRTGSEEQA